MDNYGTGSKKLVIFAPISPQWNGIADVREKFERYTQVYSIYYVDTLSITENCMTITDAKLRFKNYLGRYCQDAAAIMGFAFGGTLLQHIVGDKLLKQCKLAFISSPTYANDELISKLQTVIALLQKDQLLEALNVVEHLVQPENCINNTNLVNIDFIKNTVQAQKRLLQGYSLMIQANATDEIKAIHQESVAIIGAFSQLATLNNVLMPSQQIKVIPHAGMRVLESDPERIYPILDELLLKDYK